MSKKAASALSKIVAKAMKATSESSLTIKKAASIFGADKRLRTNVLRICDSNCLLLAVQAGVISDHRAIVPMLRVNAFASALILETETRLGRTISHKRASVLVTTFLRIRNERLSLESVKNFLKATEEHLLLCRSEIAA